MSGDVIGCRGTADLAQDPQSLWKFTTPDEVTRLWPKLTRHLGRRRPFWEFLLDEWWQQGRLAIHVSG